MENGLVLSFFFYLEGQSGRSVTLRSSTTNSKFRDATNTATAFTHLLSLSCQYIINSTSSVSELIFILHSVYPVPARVVGSKVNTRSTVSAVYRKNKHPSHLVAGGPYWPKCSNFLLQQVKTGVLNTQEPTARVPISLSQVTAPKFFLQQLIKAIPLQTWKGPWGSRRLRLLEFLDNRHMKVVRFSAVRTGPLYPQEGFLVLISVRG
jgi:hypothetical protein